MIVWSVLGCAPPELTEPAPAEVSCNSLWALYTAYQHGVQCNEPTGVDPGDSSYRCAADQPVNACATERFEDPQVPEPVGDGPERIYLPACPHEGPCDPLEVARCTDGTRPAITLGRAAPGSEHARSWVIHFDGAGRPCGGHEPCLDIYRVGPSLLNARALSTSHPGLSEWPRPVQRTGILSNDEANEFSAFNRVAFDRCVSASQGSDRRVFVSVPEVENRPGDTVEVFYRSDAIFRSLLQGLRDAGVADAERVVLTGGSDGARWLVHAADRYADMVREVAPQAEVSVVFDSNFRPMMSGEAYHALEACGGGADGVDLWTADYHNEAGLQVVCEDPARRYPYSPANFSPAGPGGGPGVIHLEAESFRILADDSCMLTHAADPHPGEYCRNSLHVLAHHVQTPYFVLGRLADEKSRAADWLVLPGAEAAFFTPEETVARVRKQAIDLVEGWATAADEVRPPGSRPPGVLLNEGDGHTFLLSPSFHAARITDCEESDVITVDEAVMRWVADESVVLIDGYQDVFTDPLKCR